MITQSRLKELLHYNPETGVFTRKVANNRNVHIGAIAGSTHSNGYRYIKIKWRGYLAHRLAWLYVNGEFPPNQIDHKNHDRADNRISNLRAVTNKENHKNMSMRRTNTSGHVGVCWDKKRKKWRAQITVAKRCIQLGRFDSIDFAIAARKQAEKKYGFHPNHGC